MRQGVWDTSEAGGSDVMAILGNHRGVDRKGGPSRHSAGPELGIVNRRFCAQRRGSI